MSAAESSRHGADMQATAPKIYSYDPRTIPRTCGFCSDRMQRIGTKGNEHIMLCKHNKLQYISNATMFCLACRQYSSNYTQYPNGLAVCGNEGCITNEMTKCVSDSCQPHDVPYGWTIKQYWPMENPENTTWYIEKMPYVFVCHPHQWFYVNSAPTIREIYNYYIDPRLISFPCGMCKAKTHLLQHDNGDNAHMRFCENIAWHPTAQTTMLCLLCQTTSYEKSPCANGIYKCPTKDCPANETTHIDTAYGVIDPVAFTFSAIFNTSNESNRKSYHAFQRKKASNPCSRVLTDVQASYPLLINNIEVWGPIIYKSKPSAKACGVCLEYMKNKSPLDEYTHLQYCYCTKPVFQIYCFVCDRYSISQENSNCAHYDCLASLSCDCQICGPDHKVSYGFVMEYLKESGRGIGCRFVPLMPPRCNRPNADKIHDIEKAWAYLLPGVSSVDQLFERANSYNGAWGA